MQTLAVNIIVKINIWITILMLWYLNVTGANGRYRVTLRDDPATTAVISWDQTMGTNPVIHYGTTDFGTNWIAYPDSRPPDKVIFFAGMNNHFVRLTGLQPNTAYYFVIADSDGASQRFWFSTAPDDPSQRLSFIAGGDSRNNRTPRQAANKLVAKLRPHAVLFGGDMTETGTSVEWVQWFDDWQLTIGADGRIIPIVATRGNHESSNAILENLFDVPDPNVYYALTFGGGLVRTYTLNTEISITGNQTDWLKSDLAANSAVIWKMAQYHRPMRPHVSAKPEGTNQYSSWAGLFYQNKVKLVVECDAHTVKTTWPIRPDTGPGSDEGFTRDDTYGTVYTGEGCWGAPLRTNDDNKAWTRGSGMFNQFKWIFIDQGKMELRTIDVNNADQVGSVNDSDIFTPPANLNIWDPGNGAVVVINQSSDPPNMPPSVSITAPANGQWYPSPQQVTISAQASDADGTIQKVDFYGNNIFISTVNALPYSTGWLLPGNGIHEISATAFDNDSASASSAKVSVLVGAFSDTVSSRISSGSDDVEESEAGLMYFTSSDLEMVFDSWNSMNNQTVGLRFTNLKIPQGARITGAYIQFVTDEATSAVCDLTIYGESADDAAPFAADSFNVSLRARTNTSVNWLVDPWTAVGRGGTSERTPDLSPLIQEITDRQGWQVDNAIAIIITGGGSRVAEAYEGMPALAPILYVYYDYNGPAGIRSPGSGFLDIAIYPNPTNGELRIANYELRIMNYEVRIYDVYGRAVEHYQQRATNNEQLNINHLPTGIYILVVEAGGWRVARKIIKQ